MLGTGGNAGAGISISAKVYMLLRICAPTFFKHVFSWHGPRTSCDAGHSASRSAIGNPASGRGDLAAPRFFSSQQEQAAGGVVATAITLCAHKRLNYELGWVVWQGSAAATDPCQCGIVGAWPAQGCVQHYSRGACRHQTSSQIRVWLMQGACMSATCTCSTCTYTQHATMPMPA